MRGPTGEEELMSNMATDDRKRFNFWLALALVLVGTIIGLGIAKVPGASSGQVEWVGGEARFALVSTARASVPERSSVALTPLSCVA
jgi:hypothetical protein